MSEASAKIDAAKGSLASDRQYEARGIVARIQPVGRINGLAPIYRYLTIDQGPGRPSFAVEFMGKASVDENGYLDMRTVKEGQLIVNPGLVYKKIPWSDGLMTLHLEAMKTYQRKEIYLPEIDRSAGPVDIGTINLTQGEVQ